MLQISQEEGTSLKMLPKTIEAATHRYLHQYEKYFRGPATEMRRLSSLTEAKLIVLRKKAPKFYEERLATLVNQAASALLTARDKLEFNTSHKHFLRVLNELAKSQPAGEVNFQAEKERSVERDQMLKKHLRLHKQLAEMEAVELDYEQIGDEDPESEYSKFYSRYEALKSELKLLSVMIATMEGERVEEEVEFKLTVKSRSSLKRLDESKLQQLEDSILKVLVENKAQKSIFYVEHNIMENLINQLDLDENLFKKEDKRELTKDALEAFSTYFREKEGQRRDEYHNTLLNDPALKPKEGIILQGPDDLPADVLEELNQTGRHYKRKLEEMLEKYSDIPVSEENCQADLVEDDEIEESSERDMREVQDYIKQNERIFARVKEEPRDDYENDDLSGDERSVPEAIAKSVEDTLGMPKTSNSEICEILATITPDDRVPELIEID